MKAIIPAISLFLALAACHTAGGQVRSAGTWHSFKGLGFTMQTGAHNPGEANTFTLYAELGDAYSGHLAVPGAKFVYSHDITVHDFAAADGEAFSLFVGAGASAGWVKDRGREGYGMMAALNGSFGASAAFAKKHVHVSAGITLEAGPWLQKAENGYIISLYKNGIYQGYYPYISISYLFR